MKDQLEVIGKLTIKKDIEIYKVIDFLNKSLKDKHLIFGVSIKENEYMEIKIYKT